MHDNSEVKIILLNKKHYLGISKYTSLSNHDPISLWKKFKPLKKTILHMANQNDVAIQFYKPVQLSKNQALYLHSWAACEVIKPSDHPILENCVIEAGLYASFVFHGTMNNFKASFENFINSWIPNSEYLLDDRPFFQIMGKAYLGPNNPDSKEQVLIPIKKTKE